MATRGTRSEAIGKGLVRAGNRSGARTGKGLPPAPPTGGVPVLCERCGAVWARRTWRTDRKVSGPMLGRARWRICPACAQVSAGSAYGRVRLRGAYLRAHEAEIRRRVDNVAARAGHTQPQRRVLSIERDADGLEILTTSQKLAHRIVHELCKAFRGRATYQWSDRERTLHATWQRER